MGVSDKSVRAVAYAILMGALLFTSCKKPRTNVDGHPTRPAALAKYRNYVVVDKYRPAETYFNEPEYILLLENNDQIVKVYTAKLHYDMYSIGDTIK